MVERVASRPLAVAAGAAALGAVVTSLLYESLLVPRLPLYHSVPIAWWFFLISPVAIAVVLPAFRWPHRWFAIGLAAALGILAVLLFGDSLSALRGDPVAHDVFFPSWEYLRFLTIQSAFLLASAVLLAGGTAFTAFLVRRHEAV